MSQPVAYIPENNFANDLGRSGLSLIDAPALDAELARISATCQGLRYNLAQIQTDQGNVLISAVSLTADAIAVIAAAVGVIEGPPGPGGPQGVQGERGLIGNTGAQGQQGVKGDQGIQGIQGPQGLSFEPDAVGLFAERTNYDTAEPGRSFLARDQGMLYFRVGASGWSTGISFGQGPTGATGSTGAAGTNGINGSIWRGGSTNPADTLGVNNDLYLNTSTSDLFLKVSGAYQLQANIKGEKGDQGVQGPAGAQGLQGAQGNTGAQGSQGIQGIQGANGAKGEKGDQGDQGPINPNATSANTLNYFTIGATGADVTYIQDDVFGRRQAFRRIRGVGGVVVSYGADGSIELALASSPPNVGGA